MKSALIGSTGFVGANLRNQTTFTDSFHSTDIQNIDGQSFDLVVCAGISAVKWMANKEPEQDWQKIQNLLDHLKTIRADRFVLISTVDVYPQPVDVDETMPLEGVDNHAYGKHRFAVEQFVRNQFLKNHIIRLPGLFGPNLKKNVIFDLMHDDNLDVINPSSEFQYYNLCRLWKDLQWVLAKEIPLINFATEPIATQSILSAYFPEKRVGERKGPEAHYRMRSIYADAFGGSDGYLIPALKVREELGKFVREGQIA